MQSDDRIRYPLKSHPTALSERAADLPGSEAAVDLKPIVDRRDKESLHSTSSYHHPILTSLFFVWNYFEAHHVGLVSKCCCLW